MWAIIFLLLNIYDVKKYTYSTYIYQLQRLINVVVTKSEEKGLYLKVVVEALHGSHVFCMSSHVIRNLNWKYTLLKFNNFTIILIK